jgi:two-component system, NarL family, nitrate/nitrite response regulator NarL
VTVNPSAASAPGALQPSGTAVPRPPIRVFLVEDHAITVWGLQRLIESGPCAMTVIGTADSRTSLVNHPDLPKAEVLVLDLDLGQEDGLDALPEVQLLSQAHVLVLTASDDTDRHCRAVELGARGVLHKSEAPQKILEAIERVRSGAVWLSPQLVGQALGRLTSQLHGEQPQKKTHRARIDSLTAREHEIVTTISRRPGEKLLRIASDLGMSENTLRNHLTNIYSKLDVRGRLELHVFATEHGLAAT